MDTPDVESSFDINSLGHDLSQADEHKTSFSPVFLVGFTKQQLASVREVYGGFISSYDVHFYGFNITRDAITERIGVIPQTMVLNTGIEIEGALRSYIRAHRIPVLRVLHRRCQLAELPRPDYYGGVYETIAAHDLLNMEILTACIDLGIRIYHRSRDRDMPMSDFVHNTLLNLLNMHRQLNDTNAVHRSAVL